MMAPRMESEKRRVDGINYYFHNHFTPQKCVCIDGSRCSERGRKDPFYLPPTPDIWMSNYDHPLLIFILSLVNISQQVIYLARFPLHFNMLIPLRSSSDKLPTNNKNQLVHPFFKVMKFIFISKLISHPSPFSLTTKPGKYTMSSFYWFLDF